MRYNTNFLIATVALGASAIQSLKFNIPNSHEESIINGQKLNDIFRYPNDAESALHKQINPNLYRRIEDGADHISDMFLDEPTESPGGTTEEDMRPDQALAWGVGLASGLVITLCSVCGLLLTPIIDKPWYKKLLLYLIATATSSLMGNSLFQLIPPAFEIDMSEMGNILKSSTIYVSFLFFFIIERILNIVFGDSDEEEQHGHTNLANDIIPSRRNTNSSDKLNVRPRAASTTIAGQVHAAALHAAELQQNSPDNSKKSITEQMSEVKMVAWMLFIGDALENVADGMAMGAGFGTSIALGIGITIAIFSEEFPHKIGDFAIFLNSGMSTKMALVVNVISGATVWIGIVIGLLSAEDPVIVQYIFAIAGGVFLYVGLGGLFPEMGETSEELHEEGESKWLTLFIELCGLLTGLAMMIILCLFSDDIESAFE